MELLYLWIKEYKGLKEVGLNLSNQFRFQYDESKRILDIAFAQNYIPNFFGENITNFTGIIGENGAGKTSVLRYIIEYCSGGIHNNKDEQVIIIVRIKDELKYYSFLDFKINTPDNFPSISKIEDLEKIKSSAITIFLSNTIDPTSFYATDYSKTQLGDTQNLSTWHLLHFDYQNKTGKDANNPLLTFNEKIEAFSAQELIRMVRLLRWLNMKENKNSADSNYKDFPIKPPPYLNLNLYFDREQSFDIELSKLTLALNDYFKLNKSKKNKFLLRAFQASVFHFVGEEKFVTGPEEMKIAYQKFPEKIFGYLNKKVKYKNIGDQSIVPELHDIFYYILKTGEFDFLSGRINQVQEFIHQLGEFVFKRNILVHERGSIISVELTKANKSALEELIEDYYKVDRISGFADFYFSHKPAVESSLSSGEYAMLMVFARLNDMKLEKSRLKKPLLMLIDEAELALHPQWQKEFIFHFTDFITERFSDRQVQVILTSHSPFILSDLPPNCVVLLKKGNGKSEVIDSLTKRNETFGANIHELFTDSFFLQDGLMGEFARRKIEELVTRLSNKEKYTKAEYSEFRKEIDIIGEPFVRFKLLEKLLQGVPSEEFDNIIIEREKELNLIKTIRNDKNRG
jgi:ABC-type multidrug transport system ATPase subunit